MNDENNQERQAKPITPHTHANVEILGNLDCSDQSHYIGNKWGVRVLKGEIIVLLQRRRHECLSEEKGKKSCKKFEKGKKIKILGK